MLAAFGAAACGDCGPSIANFLVLNTRRRHKMESEGDSEEESITWITMRLLHAVGPATAQSATGWCAKQSNGTWLTTEGGLVSLGKHKTPVYL
jgi:hypothetical protein